MNSMEPKIDYKGSPRPEVMIINGDLSKDLCNGSTIVWTKWDGWDWRVVTRQKNNSEWRFKAFQTNNWHLKNSKFSLMTSYNKPMRQVVGEENTDYYQTMFHRQNIAKRDWRKREGDKYDV